MMKINKICICGARWKGIVPENIGKLIVQEWEKTHYGEGHKPCDVKTACRNRNRNDNPVFCR